MTEIPQGIDPEIAEIARSYDARRTEALKNEGFGGWLSQFEAQFQKGLIPSLSSEEGSICAQRFVDLKEMKPAQPTKTTETPTMEAIATDLKEVFGDSVEEDISNFVLDKLMPLRGIEIDSDTEPNEYLVMATENVMRDVVAVARMFQLTDEELGQLYPEVEVSRMCEASLRNLGLSLLTRGLKGQARMDGLCVKEMHQEHIWMVRGVRDIPPGGCQAIGELIDSKISSS